MNINTVLFPNSRGIWAPGVYPCTLGQNQCSTCTHTVHSSYRSQHRVLKTNHNMTRSLQDLFSGFLLFMQSKIQTVPQTIRSCSVFWPLPTSSTSSSWSFSPYFGHCNLSIPWIRQARFCFGFSEFAVFFACNTDSCFSQRFTYQIKCHQKDIPGSLSSH